MLARLRRELGAWFLGAFFLIGAGCGDSLVDVCEEAQANQCTSVTGDCSEFVDALSSISSSAGCSSEYDDYESCATSQEDVCSVDNNCGGVETALGLCIGPYCLANSAECAAIRDVF
jgi:hypothetical protein